MTLNENEFLNISTSWTSSSTSEESLEEFAKYVMCLKNPLTFYFILFDDEDEIHVHRVQNGEQEHFTISELGVQFSDDEKGVFSTRDDKAEGILKRKIRRILNTLDLTCVNGWFCFSNMFDHIKTLLPSPTEVPSVIVPVGKTE